MTQERFEERKQDVHNASTSDTNVGLNMPTVMLRERDQAILREIFCRHPAVRQVRLFGSRADGSARRASDIDLAIVAPEMTATEWADLCLELDEAPIIYEIDAVRLDRLADGPFKEKIGRASVPVFDASMRRRVHVSGMGCD